MNFTVETILIGGSFLLFLGVLSSKISTRLGVPTLLIFLAIGVLAGMDSIGVIHFNDPYTAQVLGAITLSFILFSGGLDTDFKHIKPILIGGGLLSTLGVLVTASVIGGFLYFVSDFSLIEGMLVGAIISSTDAAAVFSVLRSKNISLKANISPLLELESGSNDAMAYLLTVFFTSVLKEGHAVEFSALIPFFLKEMILGALMGVLVGKLLVFLINRVQLSYDSLYPALTLSMILFAYSFTNFMHGNGFLAVYIAGIILGSQDFIHKKSLLRFYEGIGWLMQIVMFITLGLLVSSRMLFSIAGLGVLVAIVAMFIARPIGVFVSLAFSKYKSRHKFFISWVGLKGAVPIVLATYPLIHKIDKADAIFHIVFFIVIISVLLQGTTLYPFAKWLELEDTSGRKKRKPAVALSEDVRSELIELTLPPSVSAVGKQIVELGFPKGALIVLIQRKNQYVSPRGDTVLNGGDSLMIMVDEKKEIKEVKTCLGIT